MQSDWFNHGIRWDKTVPHQWPYKENEKGKRKTFHQFHRRCGSIYEWHLHKNANTLNAHKQFIATQYVDARVTQEPPEYYTWTNNNTKAIKRSKSADVIICFSISLHRLKWFFLSVRFSYWHFPYILILIDASNLLVRLTDFIGTEFAWDFSEFFWMLPAFFSVPFTLSVSTLQTHVCLKDMPTNNNNGDNNDGEAAIRYTKSIPRNIVLNYSVAFRYF